MKLNSDNLLLTAVQENENFVVLLRSIVVLCQWHPERDKGKRTEVGHCNKLQVPWSSCFR